MKQSVNGLLYHQLTHHPKKGKKIMYKVFVEKDNEERELPEDLGNILTIVALGKTIAGYQASTDQVDTAEKEVTKVVAQVDDFGVKIMDSDAKAWRISAESLAKFGKELIAYRKAREAYTRARQDLFDTLPTRAKKQVPVTSAESLLAELAKI